MRILQVSDSYHPFPGGVAEHIYNLKKFLEKKGHKVWVLTARYGEEQIEEEERVIRVGKVWILPPLGFLNATQLTLTVTPQLPRFLRRFFKEHEFDIVHLHGPLAPNLPGLALHYSPYPCVATFHTAFIGFNWNKIGKFFFEKDARKIKKFIFVSRTAKRAVLPPYRGECVIIPNGIDVEQFKAVKEPLLKIGSRKFRVGFLSRLEPRKGLDVLLEAFAHSSFLKEKAVLIIGGDGPLRKRYEDMAKNYGLDALFLGRIKRENVPGFYKSLDVFVAPAKGGESFGIILLEAMASSLPVIASSIDGYREVIRDGVNGIVFEKNNARDLAFKLEMILKDGELRKKLGKNAEKQVQKYDWQVVVDKIEEVYREVI